MKNGVKIILLFLLIVPTILLISSTFFVKAKIKNSFDSYIVEGNLNEATVIIVPIKGNLASTMFSTTYSRRTGKEGNGGTSALLFERSIFPLSKSENVVSFIFLIESNSDNGVAAEEISRVIKQIPQKTTAIIQGEVGKASYIIASGADEVVMKQDAILKEIGNVELVVNREDYDIIKRECATTTNTIYTLKEEGCISFLDEEQLENLRQYVLDRTNVQQEIISLNRKLPLEKVKSFINRELSASDALNEGLIDSISNREEVLHSIYLETGNFNIIEIDESQCSIEGNQ